MLQDVQWLQDRLLRWFTKHRRDLPWRKTRDPYKILVSEIMLQQTQVERVVPKYRAFLKKFPTAEALAAAPASAVIRAWSGLGYNRRALYLKRAAEAVVESRSLGAARDDSVDFPNNIDELQQLPGVGEYTARAVAAFAFGQDVAAVDTNVSRVIHRWFFGVERPKKRASTRAIAQAATSMVPIGSGWMWNHAMMDFGALVCTKKKPKCQICPMRQQCRAYPAALEISHLTLDIRERKRTQPFIGSNRYWRGRIVELLRHATAHSLPLSQISAVLGAGMTPKLLRLLASSLSRDGLVRIKRTRLVLPR